MSDIKRIQQMIQKLYKAFEYQKISAPVSLQVKQWVSFAKEYISAASIIDREKPQYLLSILQMTGQAVESTLKTCLVAAHEDSPNSRNLVQLYELSAKYGFHLDNSNIAAIVHLGHFYFQDLATSTKYKIRYPTIQNERLGGLSRPILHLYL
jgi:hypothetical protein